MASMAVSKTVRLGSNPSAPAIWFDNNKIFVIIYVKYFTSFLRWSSSKKKEISHLLPGSQAVRHMTLTHGCVGSNPTPAANLFII